jgi:sarcosine oxidase subunit beta
VAYHLAIRGCTDVLILEKAGAPITGSTALSAGGVRHLFSNEVNIRLSKYSIEQLKYFTEETGGYADLRQKRRYLERIPSAIQAAKKLGSTS